MAGVLALPFSAASTAGQLCVCVCVNPEQIRQVSHTEKTTTVNSLASQGAISRSRHFEVRLAPNQLVGKEKRGRRERDGGEEVGGGGGGVVGGIGLF